MFQPSLLGGFSVVSVKFKVWSVIVQWVKRFASSPSSWTAFMSYLFSSCFNPTPADILAHPFDFNPKVLTPSTSRLSCPGVRLMAPFP